jgi:hypothetical protein
VAVDAAVLAADGLPDLARFVPATRADRTAWAPMGGAEAITRPRWADLGT